MKAKRNKSQYKRGDSVIVKSVAAVILIGACAVGIQYGLSVVVLLAIFKYLMA